MLATGRSRGKDLLGSGSMSILITMRCKNTKWSGLMPRWLQDTEKAATVLDEGLEQLGGSVFYVSD